MRLRLRFFASHQEMMGAAAASLDMPEGSTARELFDRLAADRPGLKALEEHTLIAVNQEQAGWDQKLEDGDEVAFYPPVGGG